MAAVSSYTVRGLVDALKFLDTRQSALIRGAHGIGKSAIAYQMARVWGNLPVIERRVSQLSEGDIIGLPDRGAVKSPKDGLTSEQMMMSEYDEELGGFRVTKFLPPDWFLEAQLRPCVLFLDEINRGTPEVQNAAFELVEKGRLNGRTVHEGTRIIAAVNFSKEYNVTQMDPAFIDRFWVADLEPDLKDWTDWGRSSEGMTDEQREMYGNQWVCNEVIDFISQCNEGHFEVKPEKAAQMDATEITPSRRSWHKVSDHLIRNRGNLGRLIDQQPDIIYAVMKGFVGATPARAFSQFMEQQDAILTPEELLKDAHRAEKRIKALRPEESVSLVDKLNAYVEKDDLALTVPQAKNLAFVMKTLPDEISFVLFNGIINSSLNNAKVFYPEAGPHFMRMLATTKIGEKMPGIADLAKKHLLTDGDAEPATETAEDNEVTE